MYPCFFILLEAKLKRAMFQIYSMSDGKVPFEVRMACYSKLGALIPNLTIAIAPLHMRMAGPRYHH